jgi:hypothetical protein
MHDSLGPHLARTSVVEALVIPSREYFPVYPAASRRMETLSSPP